MSCVTCNILCVTCHLSLTPPATATYPPPANSPTMHSMLIRKETQTQENNLNTKNHQIGPEKNHQIGPEKKQCFLVSQYNQ